jgi:hypothetical protein
MAYPDVWKEITEAFGFGTTNKDHEHIINTILLHSLQNK